MGSLFTAQRCMIEIATSPKQRSKLGYDILGPSTSTSTYCFIIVSSGDTIGREAWNSWVH